jgi:hypothetical protein
MWVWNLPLVAAPNIPQLAPEVASYIAGPIDGDRSFPISVRINATGPRWH